MTVDWLSKVVQQASAEIRAWPKWKQGDYVKREFPQMYADAVAAEPAVVPAATVDRDADECTGVGKCHGCLKWCYRCGGVAHVCDVRLDDQRCDEHPVPPSWGILRRARQAAEGKRAEAQRQLHEAATEMDEVTDGEIARRAYDRQRDAQARLGFVP